jgi:hypothetical protein
VSLLRIGNDQIQALKKLRKPTENNRLDKNVIQACEISNNCIIHVREFLFKDHGKGTFSISA